MNSSSRCPCGDCETDEDVIDPEACPRCARDNRIFAEMEDPEEALPLDHEVELDMGSIVILDLN